MSNVIYLDDRRRDSKAFRAAVLRHPCMAARRRDRRRRLVQNLVGCTLVLVFCAVMGFVGYVEGL